MEGESRRREVGSRLTVCVSLVSPTPPTATPASTAGVLVLRGSFDVARRRVGVYFIYFIYLGGLESVGLARPPYM